MSGKRNGIDHEQEMEWDCDVLMIGCRDVVEELETPYDCHGLHDYQGSHYRTRRGGLVCVENESWNMSEESQDRQVRTWEMDNQC